jgi:hypothetical protein
LTYLGFVTEGKLAVIFIKPSLGVSNWPVIYIINYTPTSSLALFNTAPPVSTSRAKSELIAWREALGDSERGSSPRFFLAVSILGDAGNGSTG